MTTLTTLPAPTSHRGIEIKLYPVHELLYTIHITHGESSDQPQIGTLNRMGESSTAWTISPSSPLCTVLKSEIKLQMKSLSMFTPFEGVLPTTQKKKSKRRDITPPHAPILHRCGTSMQVRQHGDHSFIVYCPACLVSPDPLDTAWYARYPDGAERQSFLALQQAQLSEAELRYSK